MKALYESILDDEDEITNDMGNVIEKNHIYNKILDCVKGTWLEGKITLINNRLNIDARLDINIPVSTNILGNKDIEDIEYIKELSLNDFKNKDIRGNKYIRRVDKLILDHTFIKRFKKFDKFIIGDIKTCICNINSSTDWLEAFIRWRPDNLRLTQTTRRGNAPVENIKGLTVNNLILDCNLFEDFNKSQNRIQFRMTETNAKSLNNIFADNRFNKLYIKDFNLMTTDLWLVEKSKITHDNAITMRDRLELLSGHGYKITRVKDLKL